MNKELVAALVTIAFGALAGGLTNTIAIWMLFHPYRPPKLFGRWELSWLQGAVPKNQERLAAAIGRTVGNRLLTADDLTRILSAEEFRHAFDERLAIFLDEILHRERGSLRDLLPAEVVPEVEGFLHRVVGHGLERLSDYLGSERFDAVVEERMQGILDAVADQPIGQLLTPAREAAVAEAVEEWLQNAAGSEDFQQAVEDYLERSSHRLLAADRTFEEVLPQGLVGSFEQAIGSYLPLAIERLGSLLEDPQARSRFETTIRELFHRFLSDLKFHQRVVARLVVTDDTVDKILDTIEKEGAERLSEILVDPAVQGAMSRGINEAVVDFLRRPVRSVLGEPDSENVQQARETLSGWVVGMARDPQSRAFLVEKLETAMDKAGARTWGDILSRVPAERVQEWVVAAARSDTAEKTIREVVTRMAEGLLERPIGTPSRFLPEDAAERIERSVGPVLWEWLQGQVPDLIQRLDVAKRVERKVIEFPTPKMEELVRKVTDRELKLIVQLGYVLGAFIGLMLVAVDRLLG